jgi:hypothetical protein
MVTQDTEGVKPDTLAEYDDDTLAEMADAWQKEASHLSRMAHGAHDELEHRVIDRGATKLDTEHWDGNLKPGAINHTVDDVGRLHDRLVGAIGSTDGVRAVFVQPPAPPMRVDHRVLNELHKLGGQVAAIIDEERRSVRGDPTLELRRKAETA